MRRNTKNKYSRNLDDQAKIFDLASNKKYSSIFRLSVILKENIEGQVLQSAVELALKKFQAYKVKLEKGFFWSYLVENDLEPIVKEEKKSFFKKVNTKENNNYLFRVTYKENRINIEIYHALTDGSGGGSFFKEIIYKYLQLKYPEQFDFEKINTNVILYKAENEYIKNYIKKAKKSYKVRRAHQLKGEKMEKGMIEINQYNINLPEIKKCTKNTNTTISMYLAAMIAYSIYEGSYKLYNDKKPINLCMPISLQKYFEINTLSNFFSYMILTLKPKKEKQYYFEDFLTMVREEFDKKLNKENIIETMSTDIGKTNNCLIKFMPLGLKKIAVRIGSLNVKRKFTMTISNIGKFDIIDKYSEYVNNAYVTLSPDWAERMKCGICSYGDNLQISFGTNLKENKIEEHFRKLLEENDIKFKIENKGNYASC